MSATSDSSLDSADADSRRSCPSCNTWISSLIYDKQKLCVTCRGLDCDVDERCEECSLWPLDMFEKYLKHCKSLLAKCKVKNLHGSQKESFSKIPAKVESLGQSDPNMDNDLVTPSSSVSENRVRSLISESLEQFSSSFALSMEQSFARIDDLISARFSEGHVSKDVSNALCRILPPTYRSKRLLAKGNRFPPSLTPTKTMEGMGVNLRSLPCSLIFCLGLINCVLRLFASLNQYWI